MQTSRRKIEADMSKRRFTHIFSSKHLDDITAEGLEKIERLWHSKQRRLMWMLWTETPTPNSDQSVCQ